MSESSESGVDEPHTDLGADHGARGGVLAVVATPIGNLEDLSPRALRTLREADLLVCEDTRRTAALCRRHSITTARTALHAHNERRRVEGLLARLGEGANLALVSDAGTPLLSDPGLELVTAAIEAGHRVTPIPGASALLAALVTSGLAARPFTFVGFLPRKGSARRRWIEWIAELPGSVIVFEAPGRVRATLQDLFERLGPRRFALARELTKRFEEVIHGTLGQVDLAEPRGEVTLVLEGRSFEALFPETAEADVERMLAELAASGASSRDVARELAARTSLSKGEAYSRVIRARNAEGRDTGEGQET